MGDREMRQWLDVIRAEVAAVLGRTRDEVPPDGAFAELGFDSLSALELAERLSDASGIELAGTLAFDYPNPTALARYLTEQTTQTAAVQSQPAAADGDPSHDPIAIVAIACRFPGNASTPDQFWANLIEGRDGIGAFPIDRGWDPDVFHPDPEHPGTTYTRHGGFLYDAGDFDAGFFGLSPREALATDPQQRLMLETTWEALERAGIDPHQLRGSRTGVFTGVIGADYAPRLGAIPPDVGGLLLTGNASSIVSGRVSYTLGLEGPSLSIDTACSSSLVAIHLAARSLRTGECSLALAGGVSVIGTPLVFTEFSRQRGLAPDGRCKSFAAAADGTGWAEGAGVLVLERLSDARRHGHPVLAILRGSAVNSDGASNGLTAPNGPSQQRLIADALADAGLQPTDVDAVEAHGTGTRLGDPIEAQALLAAYGQGRQRPLWLGSVKSNIGHTQAAAGVAGVIKMALALQHGWLPRTLHVDEPTPFVDWAAGPLRLLTDGQPWPSRGVPRRAAVSSFGISGTNAHVILEEAPPAPSPAPSRPGPAPLVLSARSAAALHAQARQLDDHLRHRPAQPLHEVAVATAARSVFEYRAVVHDPAGLADLAAGRPHPAVVTGTVTDGKLAVVFPGQGAQQPGMGRELAAADPQFAADLDEVCAAFDPYLDRSLRTVIDEEPDLLDQTGYTQPALFAIEVALYRRLRRSGVRPDYLLGHSIGELTAAYVAGVLSLADAARLVAGRARLMQALPAGGAMAAIQATSDEVEPVLTELTKQSSIAAVNGPTSVVVAGPTPEVDKVVDVFAGQGRKTTRLRVSHAFHSPLMEPMLAEYGKLAADIDYQPPQLPVVGNETAQPVEKFTAEHWTRHVRQPVHFAQSLRWLATQNVTRFLEVGPGSTLSAMVLESTSDAPSSAAANRPVVVPLLRTGQPEPESFTQALAQLFTHGVAVDWAAVVGPGPRAELPTYPFQRRRYWLTPPTQPMLGDPVELPAAAGQPGLLFTGELSLTAQPWLADHRIGDTVVVPGSLFAELAAAAGERAGCSELVELLIHAPLTLPDGRAVQIRVVVAEPAPDGARALTIHARPTDGTWTRHATGTVAPIRDSDATRIRIWPPPGATELDTTDCYADLRAAGYHYGPVFQGLHRVWQRGVETFAEVTLPPEAASMADQFLLHPALLDAALHALGVRPDTGGQLALPFSWGGLQVHTRGATTVRARLTHTGDGVEVMLADADGVPVASIRQLALRPVDLDQLATSQSYGIHELHWVPVGDSASTTPGKSDATITWLDELPPDAEAPDVVFTALPPGGEKPDEAVVAALELAQRWLAEQRFADTRLAVVTRGATGDSPTDLGHAAAHGLLRTVQSEYPGRLTLIDVAGEPDTAVAESALAAAVSCGEPQVTIVGDEMLVPRLREGGTSSAAVTSWNPDGTVLITGATGALGRLVARHLLERGRARHLLLASRRGPEAPGAAELVAELDALGAASVRIAACDIADPAAVTELLAGVADEHPLTAVLHLAGALDDGVVTAQTPERIASVLRSKATGAWHLHEQTRELDLAAFVLFSSVAGLFGSPGQAGYAAANAYLDALAMQRRAQGLPAQSLVWGLWELPGGMADRVGAAGLSRMRRAGLSQLSTEAGLTLLDNALAANTPLPVLADLDLTLLRGQDRQLSPSLLHDLLPAESTSGAQLSQQGPAGGADHRAAVTRPDGPDLARTLPGLDPAEQDRVLREVVLAEVALVLGHQSGDDLDPTRSLPELGFDSLTAVELRNRLAAVTGLTLPATLVFDYPGVNELIAYLRGELLPERAASAFGVLEDLGRLESDLSHLAMDEVARKRVADALERLMSLVAPGGDKIDASKDDFYDLID